jgi:hypothetical protein
MDIEKVKDTIRKMLNLAGDEAASQGEIDNAMRFAARLMEKHQLSEEDLSKVDEKLVDIEKAACDRATSYCMGATTLGHWHNTAANFVCAFVGGVKWYYIRKAIHREGGIVQLSRSGIPKYKAVITFYGIAEDVEIAKQVFDELQVTVIAMAKLRFGAVYRGSGRSYCEGFMSGVYSKWREDQDRQLKLAQQPTTSSGTSLMVIDGRKALVSKKELRARHYAEEELGMVFGKGRSLHSHGVDHSAYSEGRTDGSRYNVSNARRKKLT